MVYLVGFFIMDVLVDCMDWCGVVYLLLCAQSVSFSCFILGCVVCWVVGTCDLCGLGCVVWFVLGDVQSGGGLCCSLRCVSQDSFVFCAFG